MRKLFLLLIYLAFFSCSNEKKSTLFSIVDPSDSGVDFVNKVTDGNEFNVLTYRNFYNGGGVSLGDLNNDGFIDIYFSANMGKNKLYLNKGNWKFDEVSEIAKVQGTKGWTTGVAFADINGDGLLDIYVCNSGELKG